LDKIAQHTNKFIIGDFAWVELNPKCLGMVGVSRADLTIGWVWNICVTTSVSNRRLEDAFIFLDRPALQKDVFDAPKAASGEGGDLGWGDGGGHAGCVLRDVWFAFYEGKRGGDETREERHWDGMMRKQGE
jgi:hypothetical protein